MQTHLAENLDEIATVKRLFPHDRELHRRLRPLRPARPALAVRPLHPSRRRRSCALLRDSRSVAVFCPTSNLFIGSGLFDYDAARRARACASRSRPTSAAARPIRCCAPPPRPTRCCSCSGQNLPALARLLPDDARQRARRSAWRTRSARIDARRVRRSRRARCARDARHGASHGDGRGDLEEELFVLMTLGDDRAVRQTYIAGEPALRTKLRECPHYFTRRGKYLDAGHGLVDQTAAEMRAAHPHRGQPRAGVDVRARAPQRHPAALSPRSRRCGRPISFATCRIFSTSTIRACRC